ncbi:hypothetical protein Tsubulata_004994 [Turnera subulata]|uniref:non-specific serine/threonine protein kinase n=1 Tax=Turnera subulata TaxID=218843 RepID=A0A9Q0JCZ6_9ROSI|nr:hypothetical protein Tsubulata_004994 [Turnera subulata]
MESTPCIPRSDNRDTVLSSEMQSDNPLRRASDGERSCRESKSKRCSASMGTVSGIIGKEYSKHRTTLVADPVQGRKPLKLDHNHFPPDVLWSGDNQPNVKSGSGLMPGGIEEFLFNMLGDGFQLDRTMIHEVLGLCGYDVQKSVNKLLELSASSLQEFDDVVEQSTGKCEDPEVLPLRESLQQLNLSQSHGAELMSMDSSDPLKKEKDRVGLQREILQSLFDVPERVEETPKKPFPQRLPRTSRRFVKPVFEHSKEPIEEHKPSAEEPRLDGNEEAEIDEDGYELLREAVKEYWITMREYFKAAVEAYAVGDMARAQKLLDQGQFFNKKAREADEKSFKKLVETREAEVVSLCLHGLEPKESLHLIRLHLTSLSGIESIKYLRVIIESDNKDAKRVTKKRRLDRQNQREQLTIWDITSSGKVSDDTDHGCSIALDSITPSQSMMDGGETLVSGNGRFELGFFSPGLTHNRYLGIQYKNIPATSAVWVANRASPINDSSGVVMIDKTGNLVLVNGNNSVVWSTNTTIGAESPIVQLLDSGNLVLRDRDDGRSGSYLWQSFDYPSDTLLPGMKLGWDLKRGLNRRITSWRSPDDPAPGDFTWGTELEGNPELVMRKGTTKFYRSGPWNGIRFSGSPDIVPNPVFDYNFVLNEDEAYFISTYKNSSAIIRGVMNQSIDSRQHYIWSEEAKSWAIFSSVPRDICDNYGTCGAYAKCIFGNMPVCQCLDKFRPRAQDRWSVWDWSKGCVRNKPLDCQNGDGFNRFERMKLPDPSRCWVNRTMNLDECRAKCLQNCSCMAYANTDVRGGGSGCALWFGDLIDMRQFPAGGQDIYIRMHASEIDAGTGRRKKIQVAIPVTAASISAILLICYFICRRAKRTGLTKSIWKTDQNNDGDKDDLELPFFEFTTIVDATSDFAFNKKLGEGGFGPVYKGTLEDGREIAVKRLSRDSGQGLKEFKNEVMLITKLQHRNLVKLLDETGSNQLDWSKRFNIIFGIARGLLYLHQDSRLRIIHRDLKASNVLLDEGMNPKISDFGLARTFGGEQTEGNTNRVVGTYGYMAPEYATDGLFSVKSDVFSFGILLLEIVSGKKSRGFFHPDHSQSLIGFAWRLWKEGRQIELIDESSRESCNISELMRCIHISLLCVQQHPEDRPSMASVVMMLGGESTLPLPKEPGFYIDKGALESYPSPNKQEMSSTNQVTVSLLFPR